MILIAGIVDCNGTQTLLRSGLSSTLQTLPWYQPSTTLVLPLALPKSYPSAAHPSGTQTLPLAAGLYCSVPHCSTTLQSPSMSCCKSLLAKLP